MVPCSSCGSATRDQDRFCPTCGAALSPPERVGAGGLDDTVGSYRLVGVIGSGASGRVWLAYGHEGVPVAIKALSPSLVESAGFLDRFRSEAQIMAEMNHPHVVRLHEYLESSEGAWVVMEYVEGSSLRAVEDHAHLLRPEQALGVLSGALSGLGYAHGLGLVHGDLKPENILVDTGGDSKLADFGQVVSSGSAEPTLGGTPAYMSPESARGRPLDPRSDLYSAGVVLYEALAGRPPFRATNDLALLRMQVHEAPPPIEHLPPSVDLLLRRSLAKDPDLRPQSADEFIAELDEAARSGYGADWVARASVTALVAATTVVVASLAGSGPAISTGATVGGTQLGATTTGTAGAQPLSAAPTQASLATAPVRKGLFQKLGATKLGGLIGAHPVASVALAGVLVAGAAGGGVVVATKGTAPSTETPTTTSTVGTSQPGTQSTAGTASVTPCAVPSADFAGTSVGPSVLPATTPTPAFLSLPTKSQVYGVPFPSAPGYLVAPSGFACTGTYASGDGAESVTVKSRSSKAGEVDVIFDAGGVGPNTDLACPYIPAVEAADNSFRGGQASCTHPPGETITPISVGPSAAGTPISGAYSRARSSARRDDGSEYPRQWVLGGDRRPLRRHGVRQRDGSSGIGTGCLLHPSNR